MARAPVSSHRNLETGAVIEVRPAEDVPSPQDDRESWPWITLCVDHDTIRYHRTWADASVAMRRPLFSCTTCYWLQRGEMSLKNDYAAALGGLYATTPKAVLAAVAVSALTAQGEYLDEARKRIVEEWRFLHDMGIIPAPPPPTQAAS